MSCSLPRSYLEHGGDEQLRIRRLGIIEDLVGEPSLDHVAKEAGLSRPRFNQLFRLSTGVSPAVFHNALRVENAIDTLSRSRAPLGDLSADLGFSTQGNFARFFNQRVGTPPGQFRRVVELMRA